MGLVGIEIWLNPAMSGPRVPQARAVRGLSREGVLQAGENLKIFPPYKEPPLKGLTGKMEKEPIQTSLDDFSEVYKVYKLLSVTSLPQRRLNSTEKYGMGMEVAQNILLVQPEFPIASKSRWHKSFLPIGLLKLASYYRKRGHNVKLVFGKKNLNFHPDRIMISSLFTYWSKYVWDCVNHYKQLYPNAKVVVGGIYASLMPEHCKQSGCDEVFVGVHKEAERCEPAYDLLEDNPHPIDYQIIHTTRGCVRRCKFCGVWKIEPKFECKISIKNERSSMVSN